MVWKAGPVNMAKLSIDGPMVGASTGKRRAISYGHTERLRVGLVGLVAQSDEAEAALHGVDRWGDELPEAAVSTEQRASVTAKVEFTDAPAQEAASQGYRRSRFAGASATEIDHQAWRGCLVADRTMEKT